MDWGIILGYILKAVGSIAAAVITSLATALFVKLKNKIRDSKIHAYVKQAVQAAEQMYPNEGKKMGKEKFAYVVERVTAKFPELTDNEYLKSLIEGAVYTVSQQVKQIANESSQTSAETTKTLSSF